MDNNFFGCSYEEWTKMSGENCPECGFPASKRQIEALNMCGRCHYERTENEVESKNDEGINAKNIIDGMRRAVEQ